MTRMTERQAWMYLAQRWDAARLNVQGQAVARIGHYSFALGLYYSIASLHYTDRIPYDMRKAMQERLALAYPQRTGFFWPRTLRGAKQRAAFCRRMAKLLTP